MTVAMNGKHVIGVFQRLQLAFALIVAGCVLAPSAFAGDASGMIEYKGRSLEVHHAYLVRGPGDMSPAPIRRIVLSDADLSATLAVCKDMSCFDGSVRNGMTFDLDAGPRINYWVVLDNQRIQYSGTARPQSMRATAEGRNHIAATLAIDDRAAGGPKIDVRFDAALVRNFAGAH